MSEGIEFTAEEVAEHNSIDDLWIVIDSVVYDLTKFASLHPGGLSVLLSVAGKDATQEFYSLHRQEILGKYKLKRLGTLKGITRRTGSSDLVSKVPYAEPTWLVEGYHSPYYNEGHRKFQRAVRTFVTETVFPDAQKHEADGDIPSAFVFQEMGKKNIIAMRLGPGPHLRGRVLMDGVVIPEDFDQFHEVILWQEFGRIHARGYSDGCGGGTFIGLPPVLNFGSKKLKDAIVEDILCGKKYIALAVTEAFAGSDVAGIKSSAKRTHGGWILNGTKKWITNGTFADYFTVACRNEGTGDIMVAGTAYITFDNVFVPDDFVITERDGLRIILTNFNRERWILTMNSIAGQRMIVEECLKWVNQRVIFGKPLSSQAVVRSKLAAMISSVESSQSWLENITFQMTRMSYTQQANDLAGQIAFFKMHTTRAAQDVARNAVQIFGGRGVTKSGMGRFIEHFHRTLLIDAVGGGAEDILADLGVRRALRQMPRTVRL